MNIDGKSTADNESIVNIGLHVEAIDEDGNWSEAEIINIIENNLILKFLDKIETYNRIIDISSNKWHHIGNSKTNNFTFRNSDFEKGDFVLAKWHDDNYYLSQILDITTKTKFGTKIKEYHILYIYDNIHEIVPRSRLKCPNSNKDSFCDFNNSKADSNTISMSRTQKKHYKRRSEALDCHENDNVFYDEKTKKFTENCKLRRLKLSSKNGCSSDRIIKNDLHDSQNNLSQPVCEMTIDHKNMQSPIINHVQILKSNSDSTPTQRYSQRKRRSSYKKADYFYPDSIDNMLKEKNRSSNNNSQVSTPVPFEVNDEIVTSSPKISVPYPFQNSLESKDCISSLNQSPISESLTSTEYSPTSKQKADSFNQLIDDKDEMNVQVLYKIIDDGKYQCLICTNKTFRKLQLVFDHIKHYHPTSPERLNENITQKVPKIAYSPNKRYYSSYLKNNRTSIERKKKFGKSKIKSLINRNSWNIFNNRNHKTDYRLSSRLDRHNSLPEYCKSGLRQSSVGVQGLSSSLTYCHRCKKSSEVGHMIQCDVCLCWSHGACYGLSDSSKDNDSFWECDNCANISIPDGSKTSDWYRDRCRFHSIPRNELPWMTKNASISSPTSIRNICEMQSILSLSLRVLEAITLQMDRLSFKNNNDVNSQDELDILKNFCVYENLDEMNINRIETLDSLAALNVDSEDLFRDSHNTVTDNHSNHCLSLNDIPKKTILSSSDIINLTDSKNSSHFHFNEVSAFINSTPNKLHTNIHKSINNSFDGILDCEIQKLDIIPKADFDALVNDLNLSDDICKTSNLSNNSKSSILDLIDDSCKVHNGNMVSLDTGPSIDSMNPFTQSSCLYRNSEIDVSDHMIELSNDDIASLLLEKLPHKTSTNCEDVCIQDNQRLSCLESVYSSDLNGECKVSGSSSNGGQEGLCRLSSSRTGGQHSQRVTKLDLELGDWPPDMHNDQDRQLLEDNRATAAVAAAAAAVAANGSRDGEQSSTMADGDPRLSTNDSRCLQWLLSKYEVVEKMIESVEDNVVRDDMRTDDNKNDDGNDDAAAASGGGGGNDGNGSDYCQMSRYLHSLLYILR